MLLEGADLCLAHLGLVGDCERCAPVCVVWCCHGVRGRRERGRGTEESERVSTQGVGYSAGPRFTVRTPWYCYSLSGSTREDGVGTRSSLSPPARALAQLATGQQTRAGLASRSRMAETEYVLRLHVRAPARSSADGHFLAGLRLLRPSLALLQRPPMQTRPWTRRPQNQPSRSRAQPRTSTLPPQALHHHYLSSQPTMARLPSLTPQQPA